jgi:hypothetical protein
MKQSPLPLIRVILLDRVDIESSLDIDLVDVESSLDIDLVDVESSLSLGLVFEPSFHPPLSFFSI